MTYPDARLVHRSVVRRARGGSASRGSAGFRPPSDASRFALVPRGLREHLALPLGDDGARLLPHLRVRMLLRHAVHRLPHHALLEQGPAHHHRRELTERAHERLARRVAILEKQVKSLRLAAGALAEAAYLGDTLEPSDSEDEMEAESDLDNGDEEITSDGEDA